MIITGRTPSKKNNVNIIVRNGRIMKFPSNQYRDWHKQAMPQVEQSLFNETERLGKALHVTIFYPDARPGDLTNKAESVMDLLVDAKQIVDDNWFEVGLLLLQFGGIDKENPRAEVKNLNCNCPHCGKDLYNTNG